MPKRTADEQREKRRQEGALYRQKYPERVAASRARSAAKPDRKAKDRERAALDRLRRKEAEGGAPWIAAADNAVHLRSAENAAHLKEAGARYRETESPEQRAARLAPSQTAEVSRKKSRTNLAQGPAYHSALFWSLISPDGVTYQFHNLAAFVREHRGLFTAEQLQPVNQDGRPRIEAALAALSPRRKHCVESCCGWRWHVDGQTPTSLLAT